MRVRTEAEVLHSLTGVLGAAEEEGVGTSGGTEGKLVQSEDLTTGLLNASASSGGDAQSSDRQLRDGQEAVVIGDGTDHNDGLALVRLVDVRGNTGDRNRRAVDARHEETAKNSLVEVGLRAAYQESPISFLLLFSLPPNVPLQTKSRKGFSYEPGSGKASRAPASRRCRSWEPCGACCAHGDGRSRYLKIRT